MTPTTGASTAGFPAEGAPPAAQRPPASTYAPANSYASANNYNYAPANTYAPANNYAPTGVQSAAPSPEAGVTNDEPPHESKDDSKGALGPVRLGLLAGAGLPGLLSFGGVIKVTRYFATGLNIGLIPSMSMPFYGDGRLSYQHYEIYGSAFPFGGSFFLGAGVGYANISGSITNNYNVSSIAPGLPNPMAVNSEGSVKTLVLTPKVGLLHTFASGFTFGLDLGADIPIAPSAVHFQTNVPASVPAALIQQYVTPNDQKVEKTLDKVGRTILPAATLRIGWMI